MMRLSRWGLGTLAVAVALTAARPVSAAEVDKLLPADSELAVYINVKQLVNSEVVKKYALEQLKQALAGNDAQQLMGMLGLDPLKDIERIVIGGSGDDPAKMKGLVIVRGNFDPDKLYQFAKMATEKYPEKASLVKDGDNTLVKLDVKDVPNPVYASVVDKNTVVLGSEKELVVQALAGGPKKALKPSITGLINKIDDKASLTLVSVIEGKLANAPIPINDQTVQKALEKLENVVLTLNVTDQFTIELALGMKDTDSADDFSKFLDMNIQQYKPVLPVILGNNPQAKPVVELSKTLECAAKDKNVVLSAKLAADTIAGLVNPKD